ncbi:hypothetical protein LSAT2_020428, partial [Lamellibrachia satsuma]
PPGSPSRMSGHRGVPLDCQATGESLSTSGHRGVPLDWQATGESLSIVRPPGSPSRLS